VKSKTTPTVGVLEVKISADKRKSEAVEDRYYTKSEYDALSAEAKRDLAMKHLKRGHKPGAKDSQTVKGPKTNSNAEVIKNLKAMKCCVAQLTKNQTWAHARCQRQPNCERPKDKLQCRGD
jgi:phosphatidate phosphatase PAH1